MLFHRKYYFSLSFLLISAMINISESFHKDHIRRADEEGMYICLPCKRAVLAEEQPIVQKRRRPAGSQRNKTGARTQKRKTVIPARNSLRLKAGRISFRVKKHKKAVATKPLRRSGRQTKQVVRLQDESQVPGGSEKRKLETEGDRGSAKKARQENSRSDKRKERCSTYWLNGLRLSREPGDERINKFRRDGCSKPLKNSGSVQVRGECRLCGSMDSESGSTLIACEKCESKPLSNLLFSSWLKLQELVSFFSESYYSLFCCNDCRMVPWRCMWD